MRNKKYIFFLHCPCLQLLLQKGKSEVKVLREIQEYFLVAVKLSFPS